MKTMTTLAPAKINLTLDVFPPQNGYHPLRSLMQTVSLYDRISLTVVGDGKEEVTSETECGEIFDDICTKAVRRFLLRYPMKGISFRVKAEKHIPVCAGLGGGSSDAAAVIRLLAKEIGVDDFSVLNEIAASVGSDVPFFLYGGLCLVEGRGEKVTPLPYRINRRILLAKPKGGASAGAVYGIFDKLGLPSSDSTSSMIEALQKGEDFLPFLSNDLALPALQSEPESELLLSRMAELGAEKVLVSGSGSTCIGFYPSDGEPTPEKLPNAEFFGFYEFVSENLL